MVVADDKNSNRGGFDSIEKMIGKTFQIGASQIADEKMKLLGIFQNLVQACDGFGLEFLCELTPALMFIESENALEIARNSLIETQWKRHRTNDRLNSS